MLMNKNQVKSIVIFCKYLPAGEEMVQKHGGKFEKAYNFLNNVVDHFLEPQAETKE